jgi:hypothetical protein
MSLRSFSFLKPAKAMVVPGMYCARASAIYNAFQRGAYFFGIREVVKKCLLTPDNAFFLVRLGVFEILGLTSMPTDYACHVTSISTHMTE